MRAFQEPAHRPFDLPQLSLAPEALLYLAYTLKTSSMESSVVTATVVSSAYPVLLSSSKEFGSAIPVSFGAVRRQMASTSIVIT